MHNHVMTAQLAKPAWTETNGAVYSALGIRYLTLAVRNLDEVLESCRQFGIDGGSPREVRPGVVITTLQDPDGNWIEMQSRAAANA